MQLIGIRTQRFKRGVFATAQGAQVCSLRVYNLSGSPLGWRVFLGLSFKGLDHTAVYLNGQDREHRKEPFCRATHMGSPVFGHGAFHMRECLAILGWLEQEFLACPLFGSTASEIAANQLRA